MATVDLKNYDKKNIASVNNLSNSSSFTGLQKVQPIKITQGTGSGTGDAQFSSSTWNNISSNNNIVVTEADETTTRAYEIESLDTTNNVAWIWVYGSWDSDGSDQIVIGAGTGDGTDYQTTDVLTNETDILTSYYFNESSGNVLDRSGTNNATYNGANQDVDAQFNGGISLDGTDDTVDASDANFPTGASNRTISLWVYPTRSKASNSTNTNYIFSYGDNETNETFSLGYGSSSVANGMRIVGFGNDINTSVAVDIDTWNHIVLTYDGSTVRLFKNGSQEFSQSITYNTSVANSRGLVLGQFSQNVSEFYKGDIDYFTSYKAEVSDNHILAEYDASPKGGQTFFSWSGQKDISGSVNETISGVKETSESGVILTS